MSDHPGHYFKNVNFDIIHHEWRSDQLQKSNKDHKTISGDNFKEYPNQES